MNVQQMRQRNKRALTIVAKRANNPPDKRTIKRLAAMLAARSIPAHCIKLDPNHPGSWLDREKAQRLIEEYEK